MSDELNLSKIDKMFNEDHPNIKYHTKPTVIISIKILIYLFVTQGWILVLLATNFRQRKNILKLKPRKSPDGHGKSHILSQLRKLEIDNLAHKKEAKVIYDKKRRQDITRVAIAMDFEKNLPVPNITTNDFYYKRH